MFAFATTHTYASEGNFDLGFSDDKKAFTLNFKASFEAVADSGQSPAPIATRTFCIVLPLEDDSQGGEIAFRISGFATTRPASSASLILSVNGQTAVADFAAGIEESFVHELRFKAMSATECRLCVFLVAGRESGNDQAAAFLNAAAIDAEVEGASK
jgi:hypothetical protein